MPDRPSLDVAFDEIISRADYKAGMSGSEDSFDVVAWLRESWAKLGTLQEASDTAFWVTIIAGCTILVVLLAHITYTIVRALRPLARGGPGRAAEKIKPLQTPQQLIAKADGLAAEGDFRGAVRGLYLVLVRELQIKGILPRTRAQTNWEHVRHLAAKPALVQHVRPFAQTFDEKWYGGRSAGPEDVLRCRQWLQEALQEVEEA